MAATKVMQLLANLSETGIFPSHAGEMSENALDLWSAFAIMDLCLGE